MGTESINKLQPDRTLYLRGFTGVGAAASLVHTSPSGFTVCGVFRDMADFCVLNIFDADNIFEHYSVRYLPDFNLAGMVLQFDVQYHGLQPLDSSKYSWIDWAHLDTLSDQEQPTRTRLWDHAQLMSADYNVASATCHFTTAATGCRQYDRLTLFVNNVSFDYVATEGDSSATVANFFVNSINGYDWSNFGSHSINVLASTDGSGSLTLKNARTGTARLQGNQLSYLSGIPFPGIAAGSAIYVGGAPCTVQAVLDAHTLTLASTNGLTAGATYSYLAEYGGLDGNSVTAYFVVRPGNVSLQVDSPLLALTGGNSDNVTWRITLDFSALGIDRLRQAWITFAPQLTSGGEYRDTEWTAQFSNWTVSDPNGIRALRCAAPGSLRIPNNDPIYCTFTGDWQTISANNYWRGFAKSCGPGASLTVRYQMSVAHELYLGTSLMPKRGTISISIDGDQPFTLNCGVNVSSELVTRRLLKTSVPAGSHTVTFSAANFAADETFLFDYLEAALPGPFYDSPVVYNSLSPALDFDTDATYKVSPQRLLWHLTKLGFRGHLNEYLGVFWWNQRKRSSQDVTVIFPQIDVTFSGTPNPGDRLSIRIGYIDANTPGFTITKDVAQWDTLATITNHFVYYLNSATVAVRAVSNAAGQLSLISRAPVWSNGDRLDVSSTGTTGISASSASFSTGVDGTWVVDPAQPEPLNYPIRTWHSDLFAACAAAGLLITTSFSMELVNPPDDGQPGNEWKARYADHSAVDTDTGFASLKSSQCAPIPNLTEYQTRAYLSMAALQDAAGLTPWLQFGEFLWWFFSSFAQPVGYCSETDPISIGVAQPHGFRNGDRVVLSGIQGCTAANGTWPVTVTGPTHFTIPVSANAAWLAGSGVIRGGSMAYYDAITQAAAQQALGRDLNRFTCQDDDPQANGGADASFLAARLEQHVLAICTAVRAQFPLTQFELLYPNDVNHPTCYAGPSIAAPQGGRLNAAVNLPASWKSKQTSPFNRLKVEALSWGATYANLQLAEEAIRLGSTPPLTWQIADLAYLVPWFNGHCPWPTELDLASRFVPLVNLWAYDHMALMSWPIPLNNDLRRFTRLA